MQADLTLSRPNAIPQPSIGRLVKTAVSWLIPSVADCVFLICLFGALFTGARMLSSDGDPGRHLAVGEYILDSGSIPNQDVFSHTMGGEHFVPYEWLAEVSSALSYRLAGLAGPVMLHGAAIGLAFVILFAQIRRRETALSLALLVTLLAMVTSAVHWLARPHVFTFLGTAIFSAVLDGWYHGRLSRRWLWALPPVMAVWANVHGGFLVAFLLIGAYGAADLLRWMAAAPEEATQARTRLRTLLLTGLATLAATLVNPAGPALLQHVTGYFGKQLLVDHTHEYMSPNFHEKTLWIFAGMLLLTVAATAWSRRRPALHEGFLFLGFAFCSLYATRNVPLFAIVTAPILASQLASLGTLGDERRLAGRVIAAVRRFLARRDQRYAWADARASGYFWPLLLMGSLLLIASAQHNNGRAALGQEIDPKRQPVEAVAYLKDHLPAGNVFNEFGWGGYLLHELWPAQRVFIDGQTDFYGEPLTREYMQVASLSPGWEQILARYDVQWVISPTDSRLIRHLKGLPEWQVVYQDTFATVLVKGRERS